MARFSFCLYQSLTDLCSSIPLYVKCRRGGRNVRKNWLFLPFTSTKIRFIPVLPIWRWNEIMDEQPVPWRQLRGIVIGNNFIFFLITAFDHALFWYVLSLSLIDIVWRYHNFSGLFVINSIWLNIQIIQLI